jgi:hypothetical protein
MCTWRSTGWSRTCAVADEAISSSQIGSDLGILSTFSEAAAQKVFFRAQQDWPKLLQRWNQEAQAPDLPIPGGPAE